MEKNNKEFNELEDKLWGAKETTLLGKVVSLGIGSLLGGGMIALAMGMHLKEGHMTQDIGGLYAWAASLLTVSAIVGIPSYLIGKYQQKKIKDNFFENTLFPDYFLEYKS